jgi:hypothetical protein
VVLQRWGCSKGFNLANMLHKADANGSASREAAAMLQLLDGLLCDNSSKVQGLCRSTAVNSDEQ